MKTEKTVSIFYKTTLFLFLLFTSCVIRQQTLPFNEQAEEFIEDLNRKDVDAMMAVSGVPFYFRNQEWETTQDGIGFTIGNTQDDVLSDKETLSAFFKKLFSRVKVEQTKTAANPSSKSELLENQLKGAPDQWSHLELYVFRRGLGDVEHIAIVGVDSQSRKVIAFYIN